MVIILNKQQIKFKTDKMKLCNCGSGKELIKKIFYILGATFLGLSIIGLLTDNIILVVWLMGFAWCSIIFGLIKYIR